MAANVVQPPEYDPDRHSLSESEVQRIVEFCRRLVAGNSAFEVTSRTDSGGVRWVEITGPRQLTIRKSAGLYAALIGGGRSMIATSGLDEILARVEKMLVQDAPA